VLEPVCNVYGSVGFSRMAVKVTAGQYVGNRVVCRSVVSLN
jgi:hypothetical protein